MSVAKRVAISGMLTALALVCSYVDNLIPVFNTIPGMKLGLANIVILVALYVLGIREAIVINVLRVSLAGMLFGTLQSFLFSLGGAVLSLIAMILMMKVENRLDGAFYIKLAIVSELGALFHISGQLLVACLFIAPKVLAYYSLYMYLCAAICGVIISIPGAVVIRIIRKNTFDMA